VLFVCLFFKSSTLTDIFHSFSRLELDRNQDDDEDDVSEESDEDETPVNQKSKGKSAESSDTKVISSIFDLKSFSLLADVLPWSCEQKDTSGKGGDPKPPQKADEEIKTKMDFLLNW